MWNGIPIEERYVFTPKINIENRTLRRIDVDFYLVLLLIPSTREERHLGISQKYQKQKQTVMIHDKFDPSPLCIWCRDGEPYIELTQHNTTIDVV